MNYNDLEATQRLISKIVSGVSAAVYGQFRTLQLLASAFIIGGNVLIEGPPGIAKTRTARYFARSLGLSFSRIQFTPDLMPSDITGVSVYEPKTGDFRFVPGPVFADIILADEINRTPPKTQAALLEAMEERRVTIDGKRRVLSDFFWVMATQNPIEHEGTYPLPEAQLDRFLFKIKMSYPQHDDEVQMVGMLSNSPRDDIEHSEPLDGTSPFVAEIRAAREVLQNIVLERPLVDYIVRIVEATRQHPDILLGASPRAALNLALAAKMNAIFDGRDYAIPDDVKSMASHVLSHRIIIDPMFGKTTNDPEKLIEAIMEKTNVPTRSSM